MRDLVPIDPRHSDYEAWRLWKLAGLPTTGAYQLQYHRLYKRAMAQLYGSWIFQAPHIEKDVQSKFERDSGLLRAA